MYGLLYVIALLTYYFYLGSDRFNVNMPLIVIARVARSISQIAFICMIGSIDAANMENKWKIILSTIGAVVFTGL